MNKRLAILAFSTCIILASCEMNPSIIQPKGDEITFSTTTPLNGDVGIFIDSPISYKNLQASSEGGKLSTKAKVYWPGEGELALDEKVKFIAYSPYSQDNDKVVIGSFVAEPDQSGDENFEKADLLMARSDVSHAEGGVEFKFEHKLAKIIFYVLEESESEKSVQGLISAVSVNFNNTEVLAAGGKTDLKPHLSASFEDGVKAYEVLVAPQKASINLAIDLGTEKKQYSSRQIELQGGKSYVCSKVIRSEKSAFTCNYEEKDWLDAPESTYAIPADSGVEFTEMTEEGIYTLKGEYAEAFYLFDTLNSQIITSGNNLKAFYKILDFPNGLYFSLELSSASLSAGKSLTGSLECWGISGMPSKSSINLKVAQVKNDLYYLTDETNSLAYIITK